MLPALRTILLGGAAPPTLDINFMTSLDARLTLARAGNTASSGLYTDATGSSVTTYLANEPRFLSGGFLLEGAVTNRLLNSAAPVTQTTASLATGVYSLWVIGTGTATSSAGTATITGAGVASAGVPNSFTVTVSGTVTVTVAGALTRFQCEAGTFPTSYIPTVGTVQTRGNDALTLPMAGWFNATAGTFVTEFSVEGINAADNVLFDANSSSVVRQRLSITSGLLRSSWGAIAANTATGVSAGTIYKAGYTYSGVLGTAMLSGGALASAAISTNGAGGTTLTIGSVTTTNAQPLSGFLRRLRYWPRALTTTELRLATS